MQYVTRTGSVSGRGRRVVADADVDYSLLNDEQLIVERARLRSQLEELAANPGSSPVVGRMLQDMEREIERMTDALRHRGRSHHPSSGRTILRRFRSVSWPPDTDRD